MRGVPQQWDTTLRRTQRGGKVSLTTFGGVALVAIFGALVGGSLWADLAPSDTFGPPPARRSTLLVPTLTAVAALGVHSGLSKRRCPSA